MVIKTKPKRSHCSLDSKKCIALDFSNCSFFLDVNFVLKQKFDLSEHFELNFKVLEQALTQRRLAYGPVRVEIYGYNSLQKRIKEQCANIFKTFDALNAKQQTVIFKVIS